jgi:c-di-GMP-binding flagellar brake protein YcgR
LDVDWEYKPASPLGKRAFIRIKSEDISALFETREIFVKIATSENTYTGRLLDISEGGLSLCLPALLEENRPVKVGFFLGTMKIISKAVVRHTQKKGATYTTGIKFIDLDKECAEYISGLYASRILHQTY